MSGFDLNRTFSVAAHDAPAAVSPAALAPPLTRALRFIAEIGYKTRKCWDRGMQGILLV